MSTPATQTSGLYSRSAHPNGYWTSLRDKLIKLCISTNELTIFPPKPKAFPVVDNDDITQTRNPEVTADPFQASLSTQ